MFFNSWEYAVFLPAVVLVYYCLNLRAQNLLLLAASYLFYGFWDWRFLTLLWLSTAVDFTVARAMRQHPLGSQARKRLLLISLCTNLGLLGFFKYFNFFIDSASMMLAGSGLDINPWALQIILPVGISFYTFQTLAYTIDVYRGRVEPTDDITVFALYVAFFPQLVAGPIERAQHLLPILSGKREVDIEAIGSGLWLILVGLVRKIAIADFLAGGVDAAFSNPGEFDSLRMFGAVLSFSLMIYGDFAGYTDIARGSSRLLGIDLMVNFTQPYFSRSLTEFWQRWHISLSTWLRDYLYIPLGGNRGGSLATYRNLMITMLLGGLWHGASWNFVIWGGLHGLYLAVHRAWTGRRGEVPKTVIGNAVGIGVTFLIVSLTWIPFRAATLGQTLAIFDTLAQGTYSLGVEAIWDFQRLLIAVALLLLIDVPLRLFEDREGVPTRRIPILARGAYGGVLVIGLLILGDRVNAPFIYFQF